jgi:hypothetical protein
MPYTARALFCISGYMPVVAEAPIVSTLCSRVALGQQFDAANLVAAVTSQVGKVNYNGTIVGVEVQQQTGSDCLYGPPRRFARCLTVKKYRDIV